jgi:hypothetical protein
MVRESTRIPPSRSSSQAVYDPVPADAGLSTSMLLIVGRDMTKASLLVGGAIAIAIAAACSKDDPTPLGPTPAGAVPPLDSAASPSAQPTPPASVVTLPPAVASASALVPVPAPAPKATALAPAKSAPACGDKPLPPCPLYSWMKANTSPAMSAEDFEGLAAALDKVATFAPPEGYANWASIAKDGANAARDRSLDGVKATCRSCHRQYKDKYKKELRDRPI